MSTRDSLPVSILHDEKGPARTAALLGNAPQLLACAGAALLFLSMAYDFSYLYALGLGFNDVPTTLADHVRSALVWAPSALVYLLVVVLYEMTYRRLKSAEQGALPQSRLFRLVRATLTPIRCVFFVAFGLALAIDVIFTTSSRALFLGALFGWGTLAIWFVRCDRVGARLAKSIKRLIVVAPVMAVWIGFLGYSHGRDAADRRGPAWQVELEVHNLSHRRLVKGLRRFTTSTILVGMDGRVDVIPTDTVVAATFLVGGPSQGRLCSWLRIGCEAARGTG